MADTPFEKKRVKLRALLTSGNWFTRTDVTRHMRMPASELNDVLRHMQAAQEITERDRKRDGLEVKEYKLIA
jgi:hypothetical protein